ncbi:uncharacterized protein [Macrobrachium rosenbergii]|uniref:uncharacterized protein n=1 Tax=Macrobrachium rosenbergii TaxID=79674 RepID=UPI0034D6D2A4
MITHRMANKLGLRGKDVSLTVTKVGNSTELFDSKVYNVPITDLTGTEWTIEACSINEITSDIAEFDTTLIAKLFGVEEWKICRPTGKVDLLIGVDHSSMIPQVVRTIDTLQLMQNNFGMCVRGSYPVMNKNMGTNSVLTVRISHMTVATEVNDIIPRYSENLSKQLGDFFSVENFGTSCIPKCSGCKCGAALACQLRTVTEKEIDIELESVIHIIDSSIVRAQICNKSSSFNIFVATRVAEIQTKSKSVEWFWTSSGNNPADLTTRPTHPMLLDSDSSWQNGPPFMCLPVSEWPISQSNDLELPDIAPVKIVNNLCRDNTVIIDVNRYGSYSKLFRVTARVLKAVRLRSFKGVFLVPHSDDLKVAEDIWVGWVQKTVADDWEKRYERLGAVMNEEGLICVGQRISVWLKDNWNRSTFVLLPVRHSFTRLYVKHIHEIDHAGVEVTLAKLQSKFWVPGARKLIKSVKARCVICRKLAKKTEEQCMGQCPSERLQPAPPFFKCLDHLL